MGAWDAVKYGWNVVYWLTIEGIPVVFTERGLGLTLPGDYEVEDASLVIDDSSEVGTEVDRRRGLGAGLSLGFRLLDTPTVRGYLRKPQYATPLTQDESAIAATIHVKSTTGWPNAGRFWLGHELITYTGKTATTFTGCTRGVAGLQYKHAVVSSGNMATSAPRWWRGRVVTLWASPINQAGVPSGTNLQQDAVQVWRGKMSDGPNRGMAWWDFQADSLERMLDRPLAAKLSGKVIPTATVYPPPIGTRVGYHSRLEDGAGNVLFEYKFEFFPYDTLDPTLYYSGDQLRARVAAGFLAAVIANNAVANVTGLNWHPVPGSNEPNGKVLPGWQAAIQYPGNAATGKFAHQLWSEGGSGNMAIFGGQYDMPQPFPIFGSYDVPTGWISGDFPQDTQTLDYGKIDSLTVSLDSGSSGLVPAVGLLYIKPSTNGKPPIVCKYKKKTDGPTGIVFSSLSTPSAGGSGIWLAMNDAIGAQVQILFADEGAPDTTALRLLESSGTGLRGAFDALNEGSGYGFSSGWIDADSFAALLGAGGAGQLQLRISPAGSSFADIFAGLLSLGRLAVATRTVDGSTKLACVRTDAAGGEYYHTITDTDLLSVTADPVEVQAKLTPLNRITVTRSPYGVTWSPLGAVSGSDDAAEDTAIFSDIPAVLALGDEGMDCTVPALDNDQLTQFALPLAMATFAGDQTLQAVSLSVPPWVSAQVGDLVRLELTHPSLWDADRQVPGYIGPGRVVGRTIELRTLKVKLTVLINSGVKTITLAPAAAVSAWAGPANNPTTIDVGSQYLPTFQKSLVQNGWAWVVHYRPGLTENIASKFAISAATAVGGACRLTVMPGTWPGDTLSVAERSTITVPATNDSNDWQKTYTHGQDGTVWS